MRAEEAEKRASAQIQRLSLIRSEEMEEEEGGEEASVEGPQGVPSGDEDTAEQGRQLLRTPSMFRERAHTGSTPAHLQRSHSFVQRLTASRPLDLEKMQKRLGKPKAIAREFRKLPLNKVELTCVLYWCRARVCECVCESVIVYVMVRACPCIGWAGLRGRLPLVGGFGFCPQNS